MTYFNEFGQARLGWRTGGGGITPSTLWNSIYSVYNADSVGSSSLKTSLYAAYNGESNANDSFGSNNGTAVGGLTYTAGKIGDAFQFNGTNAYVSLPNSSGQFNFDGDFSVSMWFRSSNLSSSRYTIGNYKAGGSYGYGWLLFYTGAGGFAFDVRNNNNINQVTKLLPLLTNTWYHVVAVRKMGQIHKLYVNGVDQSATQTDGNINNVAGYTANQPMNLGGIPDINLPALCDLDGVNMWNKALTQSEITELYNSGNGSQYITDNFYKPTPNDALNTYNGTAQGGLTYGVGKVGTAFQFNGTTAYVSLPNNSFNFTGDFSVSGWINQSSIKPYHMIMGNQNSTGGASGYSGWLVWVFNNKLTFDIYDNTSGGASGRWQTTSTLATNTWIHFAVTKKPNQAAKIYLNGTINGQLIFGSNTANVSYLPTTYSVIGVNKYSSIDGYWNGSMDALNVWNKELSASEITELYNSGNGKQYPN